MPRPRKGTAEVFYDTFSDFPLEDQAAALKILEQVHRLAKRDVARKNGTAPDAQLPLATEGVKE